MVSRSQPRRWRDRSPLGQAALSLGSCTESEGIPHPHCHNLALVHRRAWFASDGPPKGVAPPDLSQEGPSCIETEWATLW